MSGASTAATPATPTTVANRLTGVDAARGVALIGMMAIHVLPGQTLSGEPSVAFLVAHGRSSAAFALLAGVGLALATARARTGPTSEWLGVHAGLAVRGLAIGIIGLALGYPDSGVAVILAYYAVFFWLAIPLLRLRPGTLAAIALTIAMAMPIISHALRRVLPPASTANPTFTTLLQDPVRLVVELTLTGYYPVLPWMTYLCAGLAVGRLPLRSPRVAGWLLGGGAALAFAASGASWLLLNVFGGRRAIAAAEGAISEAQLDALLSASQYGTPPTTTWWWLAIATPHSTTPFDLLHTTGTAVALVGAGLLVARFAKRALLPLAAAGSMTLTLYTAHVLVLASPFLPLNDVVSYVLQVLAAIALATLWRSAMRRGPLEAGIAALSTSARRAVASARQPG